MRKPTILSILVCLAALVISTALVSLLGNFARHEMGYGSNRLNESSAPDGFYDVWTNNVHEIHNESFGLVWFPLANYGGLLHGVWLYDLETVSWQNFTWYRVCLKDNVVISASQLD